MKKEDSLAKRGTIFYNYRNIFYERVYFQKAVGCNGTGHFFLFVRPGSNLYPTTVLRACFIRS